ncbi:MAG: iron ABC transporter permease [Pseudomonadota bacterium]
MGERAAAPARRSKTIFSGFSGEQVMLAALCVYVVGLCILPLLRLLTEIGTAEPGTVADVLSSRWTQGAAWRTVEASLGATVVSLVLGVGLALVLGLMQLPGRAFLTFLVLMPMLVPAQIAALAWLDLTGPSSVLLGAVGLAPPPGTRNWLYSREGIILLMGIEHMPIVFLAVRAGLRSVPADLVEAARIAGASTTTVISQIILPLLRPTIIAGGALAFVAAVGNFGIPAILGIPGRYTMLTALVYQRLSGFGPSVLGEVAVLSFILALIAGAGLAVQALSQRRARVTLTIVGGGLKPTDAGRLGLPVTAAVLLVLVPASILPLIALLGTSFVKALGVPLSADTATFAHYLTVWDNQAARRAFVNSAWLSLGTAFVSLVVAVPFAWFLTSGRSRTARLLDGAVDAPYALPGIVISIAFILTFLRPLPLLEVSLYGTAGIILIAYLARFLALGVRPVVAAFVAQDPALDEAARIAGAGALTRLTRILLPGVAPAAGAAVLLIVMSAYNELTVSALLWSRGNETVGVTVFNLYDEGNTTAAAAASVLAVLVTFVAAALATLLARWLPRGVLPWQA